MDPIMAAHKAIHAAEQELPPPVPDTPQQAAILKTHKPSQKMRQMFPYKTRVMGAPGVYGSVIRHVPNTNALGGHLVILWDNGSTGKHSYSKGPVGKSIWRVQDLEGEPE